VEANSLIRPPAPNATVELLMAARPHASFHYFGKVTDENGKPLANVEVLAGVSPEPNNMTRDDSLHKEGAKTRADGTYELEASTPWVGEFFADLPGRDEARNESHGKFLPPGRYDLHFAAPKVPAPAR
jgi:hypothetical protein